MNTLQANKLWFLILILSFNIGLIGFGVTPSEGKTKTGSGPALLQPGQPAAYSDLKVTLLSLKRASNFTKNPKKGREYAVLRFRVKNMGKEEASALIISDLQWKDSASGMREGYERTTGVKLNNPKKYDLAPGAQGEFEEVYMFPLNLSQAEFHLMKGYNPKEIARWLMPIK
ncbi:MAG: hypothetical protein KKE44_00720 [Proteobacteria bacterium]|nr:hypothetical protein [Pseudomonadota bacterium]MBU1581250.1 hypothetical protein [Pseudomonadota bacterium]MBU2456032.1 hypothetical protein [Pseudomonadota bacterium]